MTSARTAVASVAVAGVVVGGALYLHNGKTESLADQRFAAITDQNPALAAMKISERITLGHAYCAHAPLPGLTADEIHTLRIAATTAYCPHLR